MSKFVKVEKELLENLIGTASNARNLLDDVHAYDSDEYRELGDALNEIEYEDLD